MTSSAGNVTWRVTSQQETMEQSADGRVVRGVRVTFQTATGGTGSVFVPEMQYSNTQTVYEMISSAAANHSAIQAMNG